MGFEKMKELKSETRCLEDLSHSLTKKPMVKTSHTTSVTMTVLSDHDFVNPPHSSASVKLIMEAVRMTKPEKSSCRIISFHVADTGLMCFGMRRKISCRMRARPPMGRLIQKHLRGTL